MTLADHVVLAATPGGDGNRNVDLGVDLSFTEFPFMTQLREWAGGIRAVSQIILGILFVVAIVSWIAGKASASQQVEVTVEGVVEWLGSPSAALRAELGDGGADAPTAVRLILGRLVRGPLAGMFHAHSTVALDPTASITVIDTAATVGAAPELRAIAQAATSAWIDATLRSKDGRWRCVVSEEGWDELRNRAQTQAMDERLRMTSQWRCSNWLIFHELADITQFGEEGSAHRNQVKGIITKSPAKILYKQSAASMAMIEEVVRPTAAEADVLTALPQGVGVWHVGEATPTLVTPVAGRTVFELINASDGRHAGGDSGRGTTQWIGRPMRWVAGTVMLLRERRGRFTRRITRWQASSGRRCRR